MLTISKRKLLAIRVIMLVGIVIAAVGILLSFGGTDNPHLDLCIVLLGVGLFISIFGSFLMRRLFRCPHCKKTVLEDGSGIEFNNKNFPHQCPHCHISVRLEE